MARALAMRFAEEVRAGVVGDQVYADYLAIEASFVETAARLHGLAVWDAPGRQAMERNAWAAHALMTDQAAYFDAARAAWPARRARTRCGGRRSCRSSPSRAPARADIRRW